MPSPTHRWTKSSYLAPIASGLVKYGKTDTTLAGFLMNLNFLTIHGWPRYPGLNIWARNTEKQIPFEPHATGSYLLVRAGTHSLVASSRLPRSRH